MSPRRWFVLAIALGCAACEAFFGNSKVAQGQLYRSGDGRYDPYFEVVHHLQIEAASWSDDKKAARKSLTTALNVMPNAPDDTIVTATRERAMKTNAEQSALAPVVEETKKAELERAKKLRGRQVELDQCAKEGREHEEEATKEFENRGAEKADQQKTDKSREVRRELSAAAGVCSSLLRDAKNGARHAEEFVEDLDRALAGKEPGPRHDGSHGDADGPKGDEKKDDGRKPEGAKPEAKPGTPRTDAKPAAPKPAGKPASRPDAGRPRPKAEPKTADKPAEKPAEKPPEKPAPKAPDEVFNP